MWSWRNQFINECVIVRSAKEFARAKIGKNTQTPKQKTVAAAQPTYKIRIWRYIFENVKLIHNDDNLEIMLIQMKFVSFRICIFILSASSSALQLNKRQKKYQM